MLIVQLFHTFKEIGLRVVNAVSHRYFSKMSSKKQQIVILKAIENWNNHEYYQSRKTESNFKQDGILIRQAILNENEGNCFEGTQVQPKRAYHQSYLFKNYNSTLDGRCQFLSIVTLLGVTSFLPIMLWLTLWLHLPLKSWHYLIVCAMQTCNGTAQT